MKHRGNCHCGHVSHETDLDPMVIVQCHCASCRRLTGAVSVTTLYAEEEISVEGDTDIYVFKGGSGEDVTVHYCRNCNTRVKYYFDVFDGIVLVPIGCFDNVKDFKPRLEIWTDEKLSWLQDDGCIQTSVQDSGVQERLISLLEVLENR
jgi:hypothetical protein